LQKRKWGGGYKDLLMALAESRVIGATERGFQEFARIFKVTKSVQKFMFWNISSLKT